MNRFYLWLIVLVVIAVGVGFYRGWVTMSSGRQAESNKVNVNLTVDPDKVKQDVETVKEKARDLNP